MIPGLRDQPGLPSDPTRLETQLVIFPRLKAGEITLDSVPPITSAAIGDEMKFIIRGKAGPVSALAKPASCTGSIRRNGHRASQQIGPASSKGEVAQGQMPFAYEPEMQFAVIGDAT